MFIKAMWENVTVRSSEMLISFHKTHEKEKPLAY
jgi:hypothetical protein